MAMPANDVSDQDAVTFLMEEHAAVEELFVEYESTASLVRRDSIIEQVVRELRLHAAMEEQSLYPSIREVLADGAQLVAEAVEEHQTAKEDLAELEGMSTDDPGFGARVSKLISDVRHHVNDEEGEILPRLRRAVGHTWLVELGQELRRTKERLSSLGVQEPTFEVEPAPAVLTLEGPPSMREARTRAKRSPSRKAPARKSTAQKAAGTKPSAKRPAATRSTARKTTASKPTAKKSTAKKATAKKATAKKSIAKKATAAKKPTRVTYHVRPAGDGRWQVVKRGSARASSTHDRKPEAVSRGRDLAKRQALGQLFVHGKDGKVQSEATYGADPRRSRG